LDLHTLKTTLENLSLNLGSAIEIDDMHFPDAWTAISYVASCSASSVEYLSMLEQLSKLSATMPQAHQIWSEFQVVQSEMPNIMDALDKHEQRFSRFNHYSR
jgi:hypothetical protein